jgi:hypothetical protein
VGPQEAGFMEFCVGGRALCTYTYVFLFWWSGRGVGWVGVTLPSNAKGLLDYPIALDGRLTLKGNGMALLR